MSSQPATIAKINSPRSFISICVSRPSITSLHQRAFLNLIRERDVKFVSLLPRATPAWNRCQSALKGGDESKGGAFHLFIELGVDDLAVVVDNVFENDKSQVNSSVDIFDACDHVDQTSLFAGSKLMK